MVLSTAQLCVAITPVCGTGWWDETIGGLADDGLVHCSAIYGPPGVMK